MILDARVNVESFTSREKDYLGRTSPGRHNASLHNKAFDHSRLFSKLFGIHDNVRLPNDIRKAAMLVALHDILYRDISPCYTSSSRNPYNRACTSLAF